MSVCVYVCVCVCVFACGKLKIDFFDYLSFQTYNLFQVQEVINKNTLELGDSPTTTATTTIRVSILDINDNKPEFTSTYSATIPEDIPNNMGINNLLMTVVDKDTVSRNIAYSQKQLATNFSTTSSKKLQVALSVRSYRVFSHHPSL